MKEYIKPEAEIVKFDNEIVLTNSTDIDINRIADVGSRRNSQESIDIFK